MGAGRLASGQIDPAWAVSAPGDPYPHRWAAGVASGRFYVRNSGSPGGAVSVARSATSIEFWGGTPGGKSKNCIKTEHLKYRFIRPEVRVAEEFVAMPQGLRLCFDRARRDKTGRTMRLTGATC